MTIEEKAKEAYEIVAVMKTLSVIKHGHCSACEADKTVFVYREGPEILEPICGQCELDDEKVGA